MSDEPVTRDEPGARDPVTGRFKPGVSGNPTGRNNREYPVWFADRAPDACKLLLECMDGELVDERVSRVQAALQVLDRMYGKPKESVEVRKRNPL